MNIELIARIIGALLVGFLGWQLGFSLSTQGQPAYLYSIVKLLGDSVVTFLPHILATFGALLGLLFTPHLTTRPFFWIRGKARQVPIQTLVAALIGLVIGLIISALLAVPLSVLPSPFGEILPFIAALLFSYLGIMVMVTREKEIFGILGVRLGKEKPIPKKEEQVLLDTSVIIDGRIADISQTGFIHGTIVIPRFVLNELQHIADSPDVLRRNRGRRGLDMLNKLQKESRVPIQIAEIDVPDVHEVDEKLVRLARDLDCPIVTNDYNLNRVAELQGIKVLNINELANAVKTVVLPGETITVHIIQEGKELGQGVGYLDDGTMVVVEEGRRHINETVEVIVTRVLQTVAGRMIFAQLAGRK
ncbi:MAG: TRAM domain-containing protein [Chloroflexi bacterium]|nr:TRAM domain-containing protein [Chloroflexota bacterium]